MELFGQIRGALNGDVLHRASLYLAEEEGKVRRAVSQLIPTFMAASINYVSTGTGAYSFLCMLQEGRHVGGMLGELAALLSNPHSAKGVLSMGERASEKIFHGQMPAVVHTVAEECFLHEGSVAALLHLVAMTMLGVLGREVASRKMESRDVVELVLDQRRVTARALPPEIAKIIELYQNPGDGRNAIGSTTWTLKKLKLFRLFPS
ncbi:MAG TPA: DUF937 domain-containing protein [Bryobacteraceae bacterium]|nr:DUF937 domain-containing protein [Bryobacteraceae bacterium]